MLKSLILAFTAFLLGNSVNNSCHAQNLDNWYGKYSFSEEPVEANAGYHMVMIWNLEIYQEKGRELGLLEVNGQQTELKFVVYFVGDENAITAYFDEAIGGTSSEGLRVGEMLFALSKTKKGIVTTWGELSPRLVEILKKNNFDCFDCFKKV